MDLSLLLLVTPITPPTPPPGCDPIGDERPPDVMPPGDVVPGVAPPIDVPTRPAAPTGAPPVGAPRPPALGRCVGPPGVGLPGIAWPATRGRKSSLVIGSLNFFRRNRCSTSTSTVGGNAFAYLRWNKPIAWVYWLPRKINSSSFSRCAVCFHTGRATVIMMVMMAIATSSAAMA